MQWVDEKNLAQAKWLEVSLSVDGELAEAVAEVLARFAPDGVAIETGVKGYKVDGEVILDGETRVCAYLPVDEQLEGTRQRLEESLWFLGRIRPLPEVQFRLVETADWAETWKQHYHPISIGERLVIVPAWLESPDPARIPIKIDPGMAFGTGTHPTTQLCLEYLEDWILRSFTSNQELVREICPSENEMSKMWAQGVAPLVIDVGCGSGILSVAALKLGAAHVLGVDLDELAIKASRENADANGVSVGLELGLGSVDQILDGNFSIRRASLVLANILAPVIINLLEVGLLDLVEPGGRLILSGILAEQSGEVEAALTRNGVKTIQKRQKGDWIALAV